MSVSTKLCTSSNKDDRSKSTAASKRKLDETEDYSNITEMDLELKEFQCPRCDLVFPTTNELFIHMRETYTDPTVCQLCGKNLNCMANVLSHSYLHQGIKPYKCPKCKYSTRTRFNLRVHFGSCAKIEKFSYKRGNARKKRKTKKDKKRNTKSNIQSTNDGNMITVQPNPMYDHDLLNRLVDAGLPTKNRDISCLVQVHIQHFPRATTTNYQQEVTRNHQQQISVLPPSVGYPSLSTSISNTCNIISSFNTNGKVERS
eukprot:112797_1